MLFLKVIKSSSVSVIGFFFKVFVTEYMCDLIESIVITLRDSDSIYVIIEGCRKSSNRTNFKRFNETIAERTSR